MADFIVTCLAGISYGVVLFLVALGLSLIMGLMGIVNIAHGALFMTGAYTGIVIAKGTSSMLVGMLAGGGLALMLGLIMERGLIQWLYNKEIQQILVTFGLVYIVTNVHQWIYGAWPILGFVPRFLDGTVRIGTFDFHVYRLFLILVGAASFVILRWLQDQTKIGIVVRAGMNDAEMTGGLGINLMPYKVGTFAVGAFLAGCAGVLGPPLLGGINLDTGSDMFFLSIGVCIVGGVGSIQGTFAGAMVIGIATIFANTYVPAIGMYVMYILMVLILVFRPSGLVSRIPKGR